MPRKPSGRKTLNPLHRISFLRPPPPTSSTSLEEVRSGQRKYLPKTNSTTATIYIWSNRAGRAKKPGQSITRGKTMISFRLPLPPGKVVLCGRDFVSRERLG
ncbi:MAG TPA: hypothetical protein VF677_01660 [Flavobacterium sp.]